ncbi:uncharacterized protein [Vulpes vulpes]|uniref:Uncharacterized protein isoform X1 n=1 Tax=Vulpes vulpes TaxID=9627 RepID=A0ABM4Y4C7_VULVU
MQKPFRNRFLKEMNHAVARPAQPFGEGPPASALLPWRVHGSPDCGPRTEGRNHPSLAGNLIPGRCSLSDDPGPAGGPHSYGHSSFTYTDLHLFFQECLTGCPLQIHQMCHLFHHVVISGIIIEHPSPPLWSMDGCSLLSIPPNVLNTVRRGKRLMELLSLSMTAKMNPKKPKSLSMSDLPAACHTHLKPQGNECGSGGGKSANQMPGCWKPVILSEHLPCPAQRFKTNFPTDRQLSTSTGHEAPGLHRCGHTKLPRLPELLLRRPPPGLGRSGSGGRRRAEEAPALEL